MISLFKIQLIKLISNQKRVDFPKYSKYSISFIEISPILFSQYKLIAI